MRQIIGKRKELLQEIRPFFRRGAGKELGLISFFKLALVLLGFVTPVLFKLLIDDVMIQKNVSMLKGIAVGYLLIYLLESIFLTGQRVFSNRIYNKLLFEIRRRVWQTYTQMPIAQYEGYNTGDLKNRLDGDADRFEGFLQNQIIDYLFHWIKVLGTGIILTYINWKLALFGFCMVPVSFWMTKWLGAGAKGTAERYRKTFGDYEGWLLESLQGWKEVKALNLEKRANRIFTHYWHQLSIQFFFRQMFWYGNRTFIALKDFFITRMNLYFIGGLLIFSGELTIGSLLVFMKYFEQFFGGIGEINNLDLQLQTDIPSIERVVEVLAQSKRSGGDHTLDQPIHQLQICQVNFSYPGSEQESLAGVDLTITAGERLAIVGRSGCGKSTLMKLLLGLYADYSGEILLNGVELKKIHPTWLHRKVGVVMQDSILFNLTIRQNLLLANPKATEGQLEQACQMACIDEFIAGLPQGYDTLIGEKGVKLSGGQRQRLAIARLLLTDVEVVIFDEATSSLDHESERMIHTAIESISREKTIIIVAHRLSSILLADRVILLDEGQIVGEGTHDDLLGQNPIYDTLFKQQYEGVKVS